MPHPKFLSISEQVAAYLRGEMGRGRWSGTMPGLKPLAAELGINEKTAGLALGQLEREGLLVPQGDRRKRLISPVAARNASTPSLRLAILPTEASDCRLDYVIEFQHQLEQAAHVVVWSPASLAELRMDVKRTARLVSRTLADAWIVFAGSREVLEWFSTQAPPVLALFGRRRGLPVAGVGPDKVSAYAAATRALIALGHRRIVLLARPRRRLPEPGGSERAFLRELEAHGITPDPYHLPHWEETVGDFQKNLEGLFRFTPPTALIIQEAPLFAAAQQFLLHRGIRVPEQVSLVCTDADAHFDWCQPTVAHIRWDNRPVVRRIVRWAANISTGRKDLQQILTPAEFVPGGTIGPAPR
jgi:DNA-binding LacI/PurR family transcriptional regulator